MSTHYNSTKAVLLPDNRNA